MCSGSSLSSTLVTFDRQHLRPLLAAVAGGAYICRMARGRATTTTTVTPGLPGAIGARVTG